MAVPQLRTLSANDRLMLLRTIDRYRRKWFRVKHVEVEPVIRDTTMAYRIALPSRVPGIVDEFRFQKFSGGLIRARWMVGHKMIRTASEQCFFQMIRPESEECLFQQIAWIKGLANALAEAEALMAGKMAPYSSPKELAEHVTGVSLDR